MHPFSVAFDRVFGTGTSDGLAVKPNLVTGAFARLASYSQFCANLTARLHRLTGRLRGTSGFESLLRQAKQLGGHRWQGPHAEIAAYDFFLQDRTLLPAVPHLEQMLPAERTYSAALGGGAADLDLHFADMGVYADVKALKDNVEEILQGIFFRVAPTGVPFMRGEYRLDMHHEKLEDHIAEVTSELIAVVDAGLQPRHLRLAAVPEIAVRFEWTLPGGVATEGSYGGATHGAEWNRVPLLNAKKFVLDTPTILVYVTFPWFNSVITDFSGANLEFYGSASARCFGDHVGSPVEYRTLDSKFTRADTVGAVSRSLSGLLFLEDQCIIATTPAKANVRGYLYSNPNATNALPERFVTYLGGLGVTHKVAR